MKLASEPLLVTVVTSFQFVLAQSVGFYRIVMPVISDPATMASAALLSKTSAAGITTAAKVDVYCGTPPKTILLSP